MAGGTTTLLSLPIELLQAIFHELLHDTPKLVKRNIFSLRRVSCEVAAAVDDIFLDLFYSSRRHLLARYSLDCLVAITADERLRRKLKHVEIVPIQLKYSDSASEEQLRKRWEAELDGLSSLAKRLLSQALTNLVLASISPSFALGTLDKGLSRPFGMAHLSKELGLRRTRELPLAPKLEMEQAARLLMSAIATSKCPVNKLHIPQGGRCTGFVAFSFQGTMLANLSSALAHLQSLKISVRNLLSEDHIRGRQAFVQAMKAATKLEEIDLESSWPQKPSFKKKKAEEDLMSTLAEGFVNSPLKRMTIRRACMRYQDLREFLSHHEGSLIYLELCHFRVAGPLKPLCTWIANSLRLREARLSHLFQPDWSELCLRLPSDVGINSNYHFKSEDEVQAGLQTLAEAALLMRRYC